MKALKYLRLLIIVALFSGCSEDGKDGNANVRSTTVIVKQNQWLGQGGQFSYIVNAPAITSDIIRYGDVRVYLKAISTESYQALPITYLNYSTIRYWFSDGKVQLEYVFPTSSSYINSDLTFKIVVIDGNPDLIKLDLDDYEVVSDYYHLNN